MRLFNKKKTNHTTEQAPQLTIWDRAAFAQPGTRFGQLGYETYDEMLKDSMVQTVFTLKKLAIMAATYHIEPATKTDSSKRNAEFVAKSFDHMEGSALDIVGQATDAFSKGWSVQEMVYSNSGGQLLLEAVRPKDPSLFGLKVDQFGKLEGLTLRVPGQADIDLPKNKFVVFMHRRSYAQLKGRSDLDACYKHWLAKQALLSAWKLHLEKFAMPTVLGKYQRGLPPDEQTAILSALQDIQNNTAVVYPSEIDVSLLGGHKEPSTGFQEAIEFHNREIARAVLGQTLTTDEGRRVGSLALGKVHLQILLLQVNALRRELAETVMTEQVIRPLIELNFGPGEVPRFRFKESGVEVFASGKVD